MKNRSRISIGILNIYSQIKMTRKRCGGSMAELLIPNQRVAGSIPVRVISFFCPLLMVILLYL